MNADDLFLFFKKKLIFKSRVLKSRSDFFLKFLFTLSLMIVILALIPQLYALFSNKTAWGGEYFTPVLLVLACFLVSFMYFLWKKFVRASILKNKELREAIYNEKSKQWDGKKFESLAKGELYNYLVKNNFDFNEFDALENQLHERARLAKVPIYAYWVVVGTMISLNINAYIGNLPLDGIVVVTKYIFLILVVAWVVMMFETINNSCVFTKHAKYKALIDMLRSIRTNKSFPKK